MKMTDITKEYKVYFFEKVILQKIMDMAKEIVKRLFPPTNDDLDT